MDCRQARDRRRAAASPSLSLLERSPSPSRSGLGKALVSLILLSLAGLMLARLAIRQIGGQTGDILGAFEQTGEILILLVAASFRMGG